MRKKCVRWTKSVRTALAAAAIATALVVTPHAQSGDPSAQPKLTFNDLYYVGAFRLPASSSNGDSFEFGGHALAFNPAANSLFVSSRGSRVAEVSIPPLVNSSNPAALHFATYLQGFSDPTEGHLGDVGTDGVSIDSLLVFGNHLVGTASVYYDANNTQTLSHFSHGLQLNESTFSGWSRVWDARKTGYVSGAMSLVPSEWRGILGGPAATGQCCIPIVMRTSVGPAAFSFDPAQIGQATVPANPLLYYDLDHPTLGIWDNASPVYGSTTQMGGMAMIAGTRTVLYIGRNGMASSVCYGDGTADQSLVGTMAGDGAHYCYDPTDSSKGQHAYPYRYQIWAYDMNDFAAVKSGAKQPWEITPYGVWPFDFPTHDEAMKIGGVAYDAANQLLYVSQMLVDKDGYAYRPLIHVLHVNATPGSVDPNDVTPMSQPSTSASSAGSASSSSSTPSTGATSSTGGSSTTAPASSNVVSAITLSVNKTAPQLAGTAITFSAYAIGGVTPQEYKWLVNAGSGFAPVTGWSTSETFTWTPAVANARYRVRVWARSSGNTEDDPEAVATAVFPITAPPAAPVAPLRSVAISWNQAAPLPSGAAVTFTATPDGGSDLEYKWLMHDGLQWNIVTGWSTQSTFTWTAGAANPSNRVGVWVRKAGNTQEGGEVTRSEDYPISAAVAQTTPQVATPVESPAGPAVTLASLTVQPGAQVQFTVTGRVNHPLDWVALSAATAAQRDYLDWVYLNGTKTKPVSGTASVRLAFTAPLTPGNYVVRLFADNVTDQLTTSATLTVAASAAPVATPSSGSSITLTSATVRAGQPISFTVPGRNGHPLDWVALAAAAATDSTYLDWRYLNGTTTGASVAPTTAQMTLTAPTTPGTYVIRLFGDNATAVKLSTSATITVIP